MKAMILAAGRGERMRPLTDSLPKPLLKVNGKSLIEYHIEKLKQIGVKDIVINHAWLGEKIEAVLGDGSSYGVNISYSPEISGGLETAGGISKALHLLGNNPFIVVNGDVYSEFDYSNFLNIDLKDNAGYLFFVDNPNHNPAGDFSIVQGKVVNTPGFTFSGMALYNPKYFESIPKEKLKLKPYFLKWINDGVLLGKKIDDFWCDVGTPERLNLLDLKLKNKL